MVGCRSSRLNQNKPLSGPISTLMSSSAEFYSFSLSGRLRAIGRNALMHYVQWRVLQWLAHLTCNPGNAGSIPTHGICVFHSKWISQYFVLARDYIVGFRVLHYKYIYIYIYLISIYIYIYIYI